jgi:hypothetical protein
MQFLTLRVVGLDLSETAHISPATQSVEDGIPTRSVGTRLIAWE